MHHPRCTQPRLPPGSQPLALLPLPARMAPLKTHLSAVLASHLLTLSIFFTSLEGKSQSSWWLCSIHHWKDYNSPRTQIQHDETHARALDWLSRVTKHPTKECGTFMLHGKHCDLRQTGRNRQVNSSPFLPTWLLQDRVLLYHLSKDISCNWVTSCIVLRNYSQLCWAPFWIFPFHLCLTFLSPALVSIRLHSAIKQKCAVLTLGSEFLSKNNLFSSDNTD